MKPTRRRSLSTPAAPLPEAGLPRLVVYGRGYCHLCDEMIAALRALAPAEGFAVEVIDVDADPALDERFGERIPVLAGSGEEICHYRLDPAALNAYLAKVR